MNLDKNPARRWFILGIIALLTAGLLNPGNFGTIDTARRLQVARWIRLGEPPVAPSETAFGLAGKDGTRQAWYGIGQSVVLLPFDALVSSTAGPVLQRSGLDAEKRQQLIVVLIAFLMQSAITFGILVLAYEVLLSFAFTERQCLCGALALLFATTVLQYVQSAQENNLLLLLALASLYSIRRSQRGDSAVWAALAGLACGFAILVRLPSVLETAALFGFGISTAGWRSQFACAFVPPAVCGFVADRWYQWFRFGDVFGTYMGVLGRQARPAGAPLSYPFSYPFWKGAWGTLFSADKSVLLFDPLLLVLGLLLVLKWRSLSAEVRTVILWFLVLLAAYVATYATYFDFGGDVAWGHRFVTLPVHLLCLFTVPLLLRFSREIPQLVCAVAWMLVFVSIALQAISTTIAPNLEVVQREGGDRHSVIVNRVINLSDMALGREVRGSSAIPIEWRSLYYLPFQLRFRFPAPARMAIAAWFVMLLSLSLAVMNLLRKS